MDNTANKQQDELDGRIKKNLAQIKHKIIVLSGKGGVGKTTVAVNLAFGLALQGSKVGILDVDIHGPNTAKMLGVENRVMLQSGSGIEPVKVKDNLKLVSISFLLKTPDQPVIWRGPLKMAAIKQFLGDVNWGLLDYLIVDSPPGTGDEPLSVCQIIPDLDGAVIVTTPQDVAVLDARKTVEFARQLKIPVIGIIENMSGLICPYCKKEIRLFGRDGGRNAAVNLGVEFLGRIPIEPNIVNWADKGESFLGKPANSAFEPMNNIIGKINDFAGKKG